MNQHKVKIKKPLNKINESIENEAEVTIHKRYEKKIKSIKLDPVSNEILTEEECHRLIEVCNKSEHPLENNFLVRTMLTRGFRIGETIHFRKSWVDWKGKKITIPPHDVCACYYCETQLKQQLKTRGASEEDLKKISKEEIMKHYWKPKTKAGVRNIYYGSDPEYEQILKEFFSKYEKWPYSYNAAYRRIRKLLDRADLGNHIPHHLRKTAATNFATHGFNEYELMDIMGWDDSTVAKKYIKLSGARSIEVQKRLLGTGKKKAFISDSSILFYLTNFGRQAFTRRKSRDDEKWLRDVLFPKNVKLPKDQTRLIYD